MIILKDCPTDNETIKSTMDTSIRENFSQSNVKFQYFPKRNFETYDNSFSIDHEDKPFTSTSYQKLASNRRNFKKFTKGISH